MKKQLLIISLVPAIFSISAKLLLYLTHNQFRPVPTLVTGIGFIIVLFLCTYLAIKYMRNNVYEGYLNFRQAMKAGLTVAIVSAIAIGIFTYIFLEFINTEYISYQLSEAKKMMESEKKTAEEIEKNLTTIKESVLSPFKLALSGVGYTAIPGAFMSFISATFLLKNRPEEI